MEPGGVVVMINDTNTMDVLYVAHVFSVDTPLCSWRVENTPTRAKRHPSKQCEKAPSDATGKLLPITALDRHSYEFGHIVSSF